MVESENTSPRLADLRRRWEENRESRLFLQLAEEYRRLDRHADAAQVLEEGLARRGNDLAAKVALGRCRIDLDEAEAAREILEQVVAQDPAHLVASKLLVEAYLRVGNADAARERLSFYRLINDRDPELDHFAYRLGKLERESRARTAPVAEPFDLGGLDLDETGGIFERTRPRTEPPAPVLAESQEPETPIASGPATHDEPFGSLSPLPPEPAWADGPFAAAARPAAAPANLAAADLTAKPRAEPILAPDHRAAAHGPVEDTAAAAADAEPGSTVDEIAAATGTEASQDFAEAAGGLEDTAPIEAVSTAEDADSEAHGVGGSPSTLAMAEIFAEQGHRAEALHVLERIVESDPGNLAARSRLAALLAERAEIDSGDSAAGASDVGGADSDFQEAAKPVPPVFDPDAALAAAVAEAGVESTLVEAPVVEDLSPEDLSPEGSGVGDPVASDRVGADFATADPVAIDLVEVIEAREPTLAELATAEFEDTEADAIDDAGLGPAQDEPIEPERILAELATAALEDAGTEQADTAELKAASVELLTAAQLLGDSPPAGVTARRVHILERYLAIIRRGRGQTEMRNVP